MGTLVKDSTGSAVIDLDAVAHSYTYNGDGTLNVETITDGTHTWTKTYSYTSGALTNETMWVRTS